MLALLGIAFFCLLTALGSPDKLLLAPDSTIKVPFADAPMSFFGFIVVAPFLLIVLLIYLHIFYGYWMTCEWERQHINQRLIPPIEGMPTLFVLPTVAPRVLTEFIFYWLVPLVLGVITWKAWAFPAMGRPLTYVSGVVTVGFVCLRLRRSSHQSPWRTRLYYLPLILVISLMVLVTFNAHLFQRPLYLFRAALPDAWLAGMDMHHASLGFANLQRAYLRTTNLQGANLHGANLTGADLQGANLTGAVLQEVDLRGANLWGASFTGADLRGAKLQGIDVPAAFLLDANLHGADLTGAKLHGANLPGATLQLANLRGADLRGAYLRGASLWWANLQGTNLQEATLQGADLQEANLQGANLQGADLQEANLEGANLQGVDFTEAKNLTQDQLDTACGDKSTKVPAYLEGRINFSPCPEYSRARE
jgi:uncharacterized protein YjbI with pentapeptide repeats